MANSQGRRRRFGSVRQLKSGRWQVRYRDPNTGQLRSAEQTYATKTDAEVALTVIEADISRGQWSDPDAGKVQFGEYAHGVAQGSQASCPFARAARVGDPASPAAHVR